MKVGDRVFEGSRSGTLTEIYEMRNSRYEPIGRKSAEVHFDGDKIPTRGVWLDRLRLAPDSGGTSDGQ